MTYKTRNENLSGRCGGFLGRYIVEALRVKGHSVSTFGRSPQDELQAMGVTVIQGDLQSGEAVRLACVGMDAVFHVAQG